MQRSFGKAAKLYYCTWCLVDTTRNAKVKVEDIKEEDLPENMRKMTMEQRKKYLADMYAKRVGIQKQIQAIKVKRDKYISGEMAKRQLDESKAFEAAVAPGDPRAGQVQGFRLVGSCHGPSRSSGRRG